MQHEVITLINLVLTWHPTQLLQYYCLYSLYCTLHPHGYSVTTNLYFLIPLPFSPSPPIPSHLATVKMFSVSWNLFQFCLFIVTLFCFLSSLYKCNQVAHAFPCLSYFTAQHPLRPPVWLQVAGLHSFLRLSHIPLFGCTPSSSPHLWMDP